MINCTNQYTQDLVNFMETYELVDIIRLTHPDKKIFTQVQRNPVDVLYLVELTTG